MSGVRGRPLPAQARLCGVMLLAWTCVTVPGCATSSRQTVVEPAKVSGVPRAEENLESQPTMEIQLSEDRVPSSMRKGLARYKASLDNAAQRDRAIEMLIHRYMGLTREVLVRFRRNQHAGLISTGSYDPLPAWRYQGQASWEFRRISARASMVRGRLQEMARKQGLDLGTAKSGRTRAARVALFNRVMACIERDTWERVQHGMRYLRQATGKHPRLGPTMRDGLLRRELQLMKLMVTCAALASRRTPRPI